MSQKHNSGSSPSAIEYGLIAALISLAIVAGASTLGSSIDKPLSTTTSEQTK